MNKTYINGIGCISAQPTFQGEFASAFATHEQLNVLPIVAPTYKDYFSPIAARRMANGVKNSIVASALALLEAGIEKPDAIITGTGMGCIEDSDKFLKAIIDNDEQFLTPTSFIQSTHNTVAGQIAIGLQCKAYNFTYVNAAVSFESALLDGQLQIQEGEAHSVLVGGADEMTNYTASLFKLAGFIKKDDEARFPILNSTTSGTVFGEGATFFVLDNKKTTATYAELIDVAIINQIQVELLEQRVAEFLSANNLSLADVDLLITGINGDCNFSAHYNTLSKLFSDVPQAYYKHLSGEYNTASAFGLYVGANVIRAQKLRPILRANSKEKTAFKTVLLYNQYRGIDHSFTLISRT